MATLETVNIKITRSQGADERQVYDTHERFFRSVDNMGATNLQALKTLLDEINAGTDVSSVVTAINNL